MDELKKTGLILTGLLAGLVTTKIVFPNEISYEKVKTEQLTPNQKLMTAAINGDVDAVLLALENKADINYQDPKTGQTVLMATMEANSSVLHQGKAYNIVTTLLERCNVDLSLRDAKNQSLEDYVRAYIKNAQKMSENYVTPVTYGVGRAAEQVKQDWEEVLQKIITQSNTKVKHTSKGRINFHAFYNINKRA